MKDDKAFIPAKFSNDFMFSRIMHDDHDLCKQLIESILDIEIDHIEEVDSQVSDISIMRKSVCYDVYLRSSNESICVEMQASKYQDLGKRIRYYHARMDHRFMNKGIRYCEIKPAYVIAICTFDPFNKGLPVYTFKPCCLENSEVDGKYEQEDIIINTKGDISFASPAIAKLIQYIESGKPVSDDSLTLSLADAVDRINQDEREWVTEMITKEMSDSVERKLIAEAYFAKGEARGKAEERNALLTQLNELVASGANPQEILAKLEESR